jgi:polysaccharide transporter, PST family
MTRPSPSARTASGFAYANRVTSFIIAVGSLAILARLLPPSEFGLVAMTTTTVGLLATFREFGLTSAAIQAATLPNEDRDALFWFNALLTVAVTAIVVLMAPFVARFYDAPRLVILLYLAGAGFLIAGLATQHNALLRRDLRLGAVFAADVSGLLVGSLVAIAIARSAADASAIVLGSVAQSLVSSAITIWLGGWLPGRPVNLHRHLKLAAFGANVSVFSILNYITNNIASILVGYWRDAVAMGFFSRAQNLYALPVSFVLTPYLQVQFPLLCRAAGDDGQTRKIYSDLLRLIGIIFIPMAAILPFTAVELTHVIMGPQWTETGRLFAWFSPALAALGVVGPFGQYMTSQGRVRELRIWGFGDFLLRGGGSAIGAYYGAQYAAAGFSLATLFLATPIIVWLTQRKGPFGIRDYVSSSAPGIVVAIATGAAGGTTSFLCNVGPTSLALILAASAIAWLTAVVSMRATRTLLFGLIKEDR